MTLRVLVNCCSIVPGQVGGAEQYAVRLLRAVAEHDAAGPKGVTVEIAALRGFSAAHPVLTELFDVHELGFSGAVRSQRAVLESTWLRAQSRGFDLVHHMGGRLPAIRQEPALVTVHDIQPLDEPQNFSWLKRRYLAAALPRSINHARAIATPSQWVADRIVERFGIDPGRVRPISSTWRNAASDVDGFLEQLPLSLREPGPLIVYPAVTHPHKEHETLLDGFERLLGSHPSARLVFMGGAGARDTVVRQRIGNGALAGRAAHLGRVPAPIVAGAIATANLMAFPSSYEGFGLPLLEAMHVGTPIVARDATATPEVVGAAAELVDSTDADDWASALGAVLDDANRRNELVEFGRARAHHYEPAAAAGRLVDLWLAASKTDE